MRRRARATRDAAPEGAYAIALVVMGALLSAFLLAVVVIFGGSASGDGRTFSMGGGIVFHLIVPPVSWTVVVGLLVAGFACRGLSRQLRATALVTAVVLVSMETIVWFLV